SLSVDVRLVVVRVHDLQLVPAHGSDGQKDPAVAAILTRPCYSNRDAPFDVQLIVAEASPGLDVTRWLVHGDDPVRNVPFGRRAVARADPLIQIPAVEQHYRIRRRRRVRRARRNDPRLRTPHLRVGRLRLSHGRLRRERSRNANHDHRKELDPQSPLPLIVSRPTPNHAPHWRSCVRRGCIRACPPYARSRSDVPRPTPQPCAALAVLRTARMYPRLPPIRAIAFGCAPADPSAMRRIGGPAYGADVSAPAPYTRDRVRMCPGRPLSHAPHWWSCVRRGCIRAWPLHARSNSNLLQPSQRRIRHKASGNRADHDEDHDRADDYHHSVTHRL